MNRGCDRSTQARHRSPRSSSLVSNSSKKIIIRNIAKVTCVCTDATQRDRKVDCILLHKYIIPVVQPRDLTVVYIVEPRKI